MKVRCKYCGDQFTDEDLRDLKSMGEEFLIARYKEIPGYFGVSFVCPDCYANLVSLPLEEQFKTLLSN